MNPTSRSSISQSIIEAGKLYGWSLRRESVAPRSTYLRFTHPDHSHKINVRISDHGSGDFKPVGRPGTFSIRTGRERTAGAVQQVLGHLAVHGDQTWRGSTVEGVRRPAEAARSGRPAYGRPAATAAGSPRLEGERNTGKLIARGERVKAVKQRCRSRACPECQAGLGVTVRERLLDHHLPKFRLPQLVTFTCRREGWTADEVYHHVQSQRLISRAFGLLGITTYVVVLEFQRDGWAHWHALVDLSERGTLKPDDLRRLWRLWRDKWGVGGLDVRPRKDFGYDAGHAVRYITKYLIKAPRRPLPRWVLERSHVRFVSGSRNLGPLVAKPTSRELRRREAQARRQARSVVDRVADCGKGGVLVSRRKEERARFVGELPFSWDHIERGEVEGIEFTEVLYLGGKEKGWFLIDKPRLKPGVEVESPEQRWERRRAAMLDGADRADRLGREAQRRERNDRQRGSPSDGRSTDAVRDGPDYDGRSLGKAS